MSGFLVAVESNTSGTGRIFARTALEEGYRSLTLAADPSRYPYLFEDALDFVRTDTGGVQAMVKSLDELAKSGPIVGIYSSSEYFIEAAARLAAARGLPSANADAIATCRNKACQRLALQRAGVAIPKFAVAHFVRECVEAFDRIGPPVILKPVFGTGSVGVSLCRSAEELSARAEELLAQTRNERGMPIPRQVLIEEYLDGPEFSVEIFGREVVGITRKYVSEAPFFVETGHDYPAELSAELSRAIRKTALDALAAVGLEWGPAHIELKVCANGPAIVEINPRLAGGFIPELVRVASGVDLIRETLRAGAGVPNELRAQRQHHASIRFLMVAQNGVIEEVDGVREAESMPGVNEVRLYKRLGDRVAVHHDFRDRIGHVIASAQNQGSAIQSANDALRAIRIRFTPGER